MGSLGADVGRSSSVVEGRVVGFRFVSKSLIDGVGFASSAYCSGAFRFRRGRFSIAFWTGRVLTTMSLARGMGVGARGAEGRAHLSIRKPNHSKALGKREATKKAKTPPSTST